MIILKYHKKSISRNLLVICYVRLLCRSRKRVTRQWCRAFNETVVPTRGVRSRHRKYYTYFVSNSRRLPSGLQSWPHSGVSRCSASKQKLGAAATLAWDRSGGSIKIFLDAGGGLFNFSLLFSFDEEKRRVYKKKRERERKRKSRSLCWGGRRGNGLDDNRISGRHVQSIRLSCNSCWDCAIRRIRESNFRRRLSPPLIFLADIFTLRLGTCASRESGSVLVLLVPRFRNTSRDTTDAYRIIYVACSESCNGVYFNLGRNYQAFPSILIT